MNMFGKSHGGGRRKSARDSAPLLAVLSTLANDTRVGLLNVSSQGVQLMAPDLPDAGEDVILQAESDQFFGRVIWSRNGQCGVAFEAPLAADQIERLRREAGGR